MISAPNILLGGEDEADWATDAYRLAERMPRHGWYMDGIKELRNAYRQEVDYKGNVLKSSQHLASIPWYVMTGLLGRYGYDLMADNGKLFKKWLDKHPEYKIAR